MYPSETLLIGLCTGSFAAAAVATSSCVADVVSAGVEAVVYAFRTALHSFQLTRDLATTSALQSWSTVVTLPHHQVTDLIQQYVTTKRIPKRHGPFISAVGNSSLTISGPPVVVSDFLESSALQSHALPIQSPFHASHLFFDDDVNEILARPVKDIVRVSTLRLPYLSSTGEIIQNSTFESIIRRAVHDTLREQIRVDKIVAVCTSLQLHPQVTLQPCASSAAAHLAAQMNASEKSHIVVDDTLILPIENKTGARPGQFKDSKIAVIGFSGRFPDAASNEELWELLRAGIDTHRTIPEDRYDWKAHYDASGVTKNTSRVKYGCFIKNPVRRLHPSLELNTDMSRARVILMPDSFECPRQKHGIRTLHSVWR